jgi:hypothetical protein
VLKVARTIADLDDADSIAWTHIAEALRYRPLDLKALIGRRGDELAAAAVNERGPESCGR